MRRMIIGVLLACAASCAQATDDSLMIGDTRLSLGMKKADAWEKLKQYSAQCLDKGLDQEIKPPLCNSWGISILQGELYNFIGSVYFTKSGRIHIVMKNYDQKQWGDSPEMFTSFLYEVLRQYGKNGAALTASIGEVREPGWNAKNIFFRSGRKVISVGYGEGGQYPDGTPVKPFVTLSETLK